MKFWNKILTGTAIWFVTHSICFTQGYENVALNKPTHQSNAYWTPSYSSAKFDSSNAVDGRKTNFTSFGGQCVISRDGYRTATWWVNLTSIQSIHHIKIYYRTENAAWDAQNGYTTRFLGFYLYVSNTTRIVDGHLCFHDTVYNRSTIPAVVNISCPVHGQYVIYINKRPQQSLYAAQFSQYAHTELCEVEVYGCDKTGVYGPDCSIPCPDTNCRYCHIETGPCQGCKPGYQGHRCELPCRLHFYGEGCLEICGNCSNGNTCNHVNGICANGCDVGVYGNKCKTECLNGTFGNNCAKYCNDNCIRPKHCTKTIGECIGGCQPGWTGNQCDKACRKGMYGKDCRMRCGFCFHNTECHPNNGSCTEGCNAGYEGELCKTACDIGYFGYDCKEECSQFCKISRQCNHVTGFCKEGCKIGWQGSDCFQVQIMTEKDWESRFYGVLTTLCFCVLLSVIILTALGFKRIKHNTTTLKSDYAAQIITSNKGTAVNIHGDYQELGDMGQQATYEAINKQTN